MTSKPFITSGIGLRMRPDLIVRPQPSGKRRAWIVKDPVSLRYFTFTPQEFAILQWLDGDRSPDEIRREFEDAFPPHRISSSHLQSFLAQLCENGLLLADGLERGQALLESSSKQRQQERWQTWTNLLAIRLRGIDPDRFLSWAYTKLRWCFSRWFLAACLLSVLAAGLFIAAHAVEFRRQLPELREMLHPSNLLWLLIAFAAVKVLHEFGHALTCKHYGGECHEMGIMFLVFAPCLYCNVTDSWMLQSRWQRIAVSAAGILVEIQIAALAIFCWWYTQPGVVHAIALNMILVCSIGTLFFNGNPLLRYDGYFILADFLEMPNLWQESRAAWKRRLAKWFLTGDVVAAPDPNERNALLTTYGLASTLYRVFVLLAIFLFLHRLLSPQGLGVLIPMVAACLAVTAGVAWARGQRRFWSRPMAWREFRIGRLLLSGCAAAALLWLILMVPLPCRIAAPAMLQPLAAHRVYVSTPGSLESCLPPGAAVVADQPVARLADAELQREIARLAGEQRVAQTRVHNLRARLVDEPDLAAQLQVAEEMLTDVEQRLAQRNQDAQALVLTAPVAGLVMEPPEVPNDPADNQNLPTWSGTPLDHQNAHCHLERGMLFCLIGDPTHHEAVVFVDETDVQFIRLAQRVRLQFSIAPTVVLSGQVEEIAKRNIQTVPQELAAEQKLANRPDGSGSHRPLRTSYSIRVALDEHNEQLLNGARGRAKIVVAPQPLAQRALRALYRTLTIEM